MNALSKKYLLYIFLFSFGIRIIWLIFLFNHPERAFSNPDAWGYQHLAESLLESDSFPSIFRTPMYPFFIASIYSLFGKFPQTVLIFQYLLDSTTAMFVVMIILRIFKNVRYSYAGGMLYAMNPLAICYSNMILTETLFTFILAIAIYFFILFLQDSKRKRLIFSSFMLGIATLCRPVSLYLPLLLLPFVFIGPLKLKGKFVNCLILLIIFYGTLTPWYLRNYQKYDYWTLSTVQDVNIFYYEAPAILMYKNHPLFQVQIGMYSLLDTYQNKIWDATRTKYGFYADSPFKIGNDPQKTILLRKEGLRILQGETLHIFIIHLNGIVRTLFPFYPPLETFIGKNVKLVKGVSFSIDVLIMGLSFIGIVLSLMGDAGRKYDRFLVVPLICLIFYFSFVPGIIGFNRFRVPILPYISIFSSVGFWRISELRKRRKKLV